MTSTAKRQLIEGIGEDPAFDLVPLVATRSCVRTSRSWLRLHLLWTMRAR